jgi:hypothetical protein
MLMVAYALTALSLLCVAGFGAWRMFGKKREASADDDEALEAA